MQNAADGTRSNGWQTAAAQGSLQQFEGSGRALIVFTVRGAAEFLQDLLPLLACVGSLASAPGGNEEGREPNSMKTPHQFADAVCFFETSLLCSLGKGLSLG